METNFMFPDEIKSYLDNVSKGKMRVSQYNIKRDVAAGKCFLNMSFAFAPASFPPEVQDYLDKISVGNLEVSDYDISRDVDKSEGRIMMVLSPTPVKAPWTPAILDSQYSVTQQLTIKQAYESPEVKPLIMMPGLQGSKTTNESLLVSVKTSKESAVEQEVNNLKTTTLSGSNEEGDLAKLKEETFNAENIDEHQNDKSNLADANLKEVDIISPKEDLKNLEKNKQFSNTEMKTAPGEVTQGSATGAEIHKMELLSTETLNAKMESSLQEINSKDQNTKNSVKHVMGVLDLKKNDNFQSFELHQKSPEHLSINTSEENTLEHKVEDLKSTTFASSNADKNLTELKKPALMTGNKDDEDDNNNIVDANLKDVDVMSPKGDLVVLEKNKQDSLCKVKTVLAEGKQGSVTEVKVCNIRFPDTETVTVKVKSPSHEFSSRDERTKDLVDNLKVETHLKENEGLKSSGGDTLKETSGLEGKHIPEQASDSFKVKHISTEDFNSTVVCNQGQLSSDIVEKPLPPMKIIQNLNEVSKESEVFQIEHSYSPDTEAINTVETYFTQIYSESDDVSVKSEIVVTDVSEQNSDTEEYLIIEDLIEESEVINKSNRVDITETICFEVNEEVKVILPEVKSTLKENNQNSANNLEVEQEIEATETEDLSEIYLVSSQLEVCKIALSDDKTSIISGTSQESVITIISEEAVEVDSTGNLDTRVEDKVPGTVEADISIAIVSETLTSHQMIDSITILDQDSSVLEETIDAQKSDAVIAQLKDVLEERRLSNHSENIVLKSVEEKSESEVDVVMKQNQTEIQPVSCKKLEYYLRPDTEKLTKVWPCSKGPGSSEYGDCDCSMCHEKDEFIEEYAKNTYSEVLCTCKRCMTEESPVVITKGKKAKEKRKGIRNVFRSIFGRRKKSQTAISPIITEKGKSQTLPARLEGEQNAKEIKPLHVSGSCEDVAEGKSMEGSEANLSVTTSEANLSVLTSEANLSVLTSEANSSMLINSMSEEDAIVKRIKEAIIDLKANRDSDETDAMMEWILKEINQRSLETEKGINDDMKEADEEQQKQEDDKSHALTQMVVREAAAESRESKMLVAEENVDLIEDEKSNESEAGNVEFQDVEKASVETNEIDPQSGPSILTQKPFRLQAKK